jgi:hypothetical protein
MDCFWVTYSGNIRETPEEINPIIEFCGSWEKRNKKSITKNDVIPFLWITVHINRISDISQFRK